MGHDFPKLKTSKSMIDTVACKMEMPNSGVIYSSRNNYARVLLRIFHGSKEVLPLEMKNTSFFLQLDRSEDEKVMATDYKLEKPIHDAMAIKVHSWYSGSGYDFITCPLVDSELETNDRDADAHLIALGVNDIARDNGLYQIGSTRRTINILPIRMKKLEGNSYTEAFAYLHLTIYSSIYRRHRKR